MKADHPLIQKAMLEDPRFRLTGQCASGMAQISYTYEVTGVTGVNAVMFLDSMNHAKCDLETFLKNMGVPVQK